MGKNFGKSSKSILLFTLFNLVVLTKQERYSSNQSSMVLRTFRKVIEPLFDYVRSFAKDWQRWRLAVGGDLLTRQGKKRPASEGEMNPEMK